MSVIFLDASVAWNKAITKNIGSNMLTQSLSSLAWRGFYLLFNFTKIKVLHYTSESITTDKNITSEDHILHNSSSMTALSKKKNKPPAPCISGA